MKNQEYLTVSEFAKLCHLNKKTLHYYDEINLFKPAYINEKGYRYYSIYQYDKMALIITLKDLGMELKEIKEYLQTRSNQELNQLLLQKESLLQEKILQLKKQQSFLKQTIQTNQEFIDHPIEIQYYKQDKKYYEIFYDFHEDGKNLISNYLTDGPFQGQLFTVTNHYLYRLVEKSNHFMPKGTYLSSLYYGSPESLPQEIQRIRQQMQKENQQLDENTYVEINEMLTSQLDQNDSNYYFLIKIQFL